MYERDIPASPTEALGTDLFEINGEKYLLIRDYYSKFPMIRKLSRQTSAEVIKHLKLIFSEHGIPRVLYSDNGPCYNSEEFREFARKWNFEVITSSPMYSQSNGLKKSLL